VNVAIRPCVLYDTGNMHAGPPEGWKSTIPKRFEPGSRWAIELAKVTVTNIGRTAVSVQNISLDVGRESWHTLGRVTISGLPLAVRDGAGKNSQRLESGDSVTVYFDVWQAINAARDGHRHVVLRGSAQPVARRARRSSWTRRWKVHSSAETLHPLLEVGPEAKTYRALWRLMYRDSEISQKIGEAWPRVLVGLRRGGDVEDLMNTLTAVLGRKYQDFAVEAAITLCEVYVRAKRIPASTSEVPNKDPD
jgi:hypothetical protein